MSSFIAFTCGRFSNAREAAARAERRFPSECRAVAYELGLARWTRSLADYCTTLAI